MILIYNNLLLFLVAIFLFAMDTVPEAPMLSPWYGLGIFVVSLYGYERICIYIYSRPWARRSAGYFAAEKRLSLMALIIFGAGALYLSDAKYYLSAFSLGDRVPALVNIAGLFLFMLYLAVMWRVARPRYEKIFGREYTPAEFVALNIRANLPIVLPWIILSVCYDLLVLLPYHGMQKLLASSWGDLAFFVLFLLFVVLFFPPLVRRLWGCKPLPDSELKSELTRFCQSQNFRARLYEWPLYEGKVLTAGVMGIVPGLRYVLLTPAIMQSMSREELESVMAHEIGHVKRHHLLLYIFLIAGFSLLATLLIEPFASFLISHHLFVDAVITTGMDVETLVSVISAVPLLIFLVIYFRFIFGYFIRNFERQADLHVIGAVGHGRALVSAFERISWLSGGIREEKNWHHFGIGERIDCLQDAERDPSTISRHDRKVRNSLLVYGLVLVIAAVAAWQIPDRQSSVTGQERVILHMAQKEPDKALWQLLVGNLMMSRKMEAQALAAYEKAFSLEPINPEVMNNLAWLLLTAEDKSLREPFEALTLAKAAATLAPRGHILDTLAHAYWANGMKEEAVQAANQAALADPERRRFYQGRAQQFEQEVYE